MNANYHALSEFMQTYLPIAGDLGLYVNSYDGRCLKLAAPLVPNINDKATAFGGSIYCVAVMSCWGTLYLKACEYGLEAPNIVVANGNIDYLLPVASEIIAECEAPSEQEMAEFWAAYKEKGKAKLRLNSTIYGDDKKELVRFEGLYAIVS